MVRHYLCWLIVQFIKSHGNNGSVLFVSWGSMFQDVNLCNSAIEELKKIGITSIPIHFADLTVLKNCLSYCNNEYLYTNISRLTKGSFLFLIRTTLILK
jgi:hypothetical protein